MALLRQIRHEQILHIKQVKGPCWKLQGLFREAMNPIKESELKLRQEFLDVFTNLQHYAWQLKLPWHIETKTVQNLEIMVPALQQLEPIIWG